MKKTLLVLVISAFGLFAQAKDVIRVEVAAVHSVTHNGRGLQDYLAPRGAPIRQVESYNLDTIINGEHVLLACDDMKGCEAPALGSYDAEIRRKQFVKLTFGLPLSQKKIVRLYKVLGNW